METFAQVFARRPVFVYYCFGRIVIQSDLAPPTRRKEGGSS
jgi:hypothetical protein